MRSRRLSALLFAFALLPFAAVLLACEKPVTCSGYDVATLPKTNPYSATPIKRTWSSCSDGKSRAVESQALPITPHFTPTATWAHACTLDGVKKKEAVLDHEMPQEREPATRAANETCRWMLR